MRKLLWIMLALLLMVIAAPNAHADTVTLSVSGILSQSLGVATCSVSGCTLGGEIVINNTTGDIISEDVTVSGESPTVGPFTQNFGIGTTSGRTRLLVDDSVHNMLSLGFSTPTAGSLIGYTGGPLATETFVFGAATCGPCSWILETGALTPSVTTPTPEPSSLALMLLGAGLVLLLRKRNSRGHQLAT
jgi:hypothetical protein